MKVLAIDTSSKRCSVTILDDNKVLINLYNDDEKTHSVKLMPMVDNAFKETQLSLDDISLLVCSIGPGSFTGVRIGIATVKAFADVKNIPVVGVSSLEILAHNLHINGYLSENNTLKDKEFNIHEDTSLNDILICSLIDAKNENVYCGLYDFSNNICNTVTMFAENINDSIEKIKNEFKKNNYSNIAFVGDASVIYQGLLKDNFEKATFALGEDNIQNGISLAFAGLKKYKNNEYGNSSILSPIYLKKSQAERALEEKIQISNMSMDDIESLSDKLNSDFDDFWNIDNLKHDFLNPNSTYFVAKLDDKIVGFAGLLKICDEANIMNIVTKIDKRNLGIGSKLLNELISSAKKQNCNSITLEVNEKNYQAIHLYKKFNFKRIGLRKKYYNNTDNAIIMSIIF